MGETCRMTAVKRIQSLFLFFMIMSHAVLYGCRGYRAGRVKSRSREEVFRQILKCYEGLGKGRDHTRQEVLDLLMEIRKEMRANTKKFSEFMKQKLHKDANDEEVSAVFVHESDNQKRFTYMCDLRDPELWVTINGVNFEDRNHFTINGIEVTNPKDFRVLMDMDGNDEGWFNCKNRYRIDMHGQLLGRIGKDEGWKFDVLKHPGVYVDFGRYDMRTGRIMNSVIGINRKKTVEVIYFKDSNIYILSIGHVCGDDLVFVEEREYTCVDKNTILCKPATIETKPLYVFKNRYCPYHIEKKVKEYLRKGQELCNQLEEQNE